MPRAVLDEESPLRGFARLTDLERKDLAYRGGKAVQAAGTGHRYDSQSGSKAGKISAAIRRQRGERKRAGLI